MKKAAKLAPAPTATLTAKSTRDFDASSIPRWGTAARVARIMPVPYSVVITSTPRTPIPNWAKNVPPTPASMGLNSSRAAGAVVAQSCTVISETRIATATMATTAASRV